MPSNFTANYNLSQWEREDKIQMEDFNADNAKIDAALRAGADARAALQTGLNKKGNCSVGTFTYTGNGQYGKDHPTRITFPRMPIAFIAFSSEGYTFGLGGGNCVMLSTGTIGGGYVYNVDIAASWSGTTCSFSANNTVARFQMNTNGLTYYILAFYAER